MKKSHYSEDQIVRLLRRHENKEMTADTLCREVGISQATFYAWKKKYGGMTVCEAKRLRELEQENARLKRLLAERSLELDLLQDALKKI
jgi:putative transposase